MFYSCQAPLIVVMIKHKQHMMRMISAYLELCIYVPKILRIQNHLISIEFLLRMSAVRESRFILKYLARRFDNKIKYHTLESMYSLTLTDIVQYSYDEIF